MEVALFVMFFVFAGIGAHVARSRGRNEWLGAALGLTLGLIGIGVLFLIPRGSSQT